MSTRRRKPKVRFTIRVKFQRPFDVRAWLAKFPPLGPFIWAGADGKIVLLK